MVSAFGEFNFRQEGEYLHLWTWGKDELRCAKRRPGVPQPCAGIGSQAFILNVGLMKWLGLWRRELCLWTCEVRDSLVMDMGLRSYKMVRLGWVGGGKVKWGWEWVGAAWLWRALHIKPWMVIGSHCRFLSRGAAQPKQCLYVWGWIGIGGKTYKHLYLWCMRQKEQYC